MKRWPIRSAAYATDHSTRGCARLHFTTEMTKIYALIHKPSRVTTDWKNATLVIITQLFFASPGVSSPRRTCTARLKRAKLASVSGRKFKSGKWPLLVSAQSLPPPPFPNPPWEPCSTCPSSRFLRAFSYCRHLLERFLIVSARPNPPVPGL